MDHAAKIHGRGQSPWGTTNDTTNDIPKLVTVPLSRNVADSANFTTKHVGKRNLKKLKRENFKLL